MRGEEINRIGEQEKKEGWRKGLRWVWRRDDWLPVAPVDVALEDRHGEHVHVVVGQHHLAILPGLQVDALNLVCPGVAPVEQALLRGKAGRLHQCDGILNRRILFLYLSVVCV